MGTVEINAKFYHTVSTPTGDGRGLSRGLGIYPGTGLIFMLLQNSGLAETFTWAHYFVDRGGALGL